MTSIFVEHFTDPLSGACWARQPTVRRLRYRFDLEWQPRFTLAFPAGAEPPLSGWERRIDRARMPFAAGDWPETIDSRPACEAAALVRDRWPDAAIPYLRRLRERAFETGAPPTDRERLATLAAETPGVSTDAAAFRASLSGGDGALSLGGDVERARRLADRLDAADVDVRGDVGTAPLGERLPGDPGGRVVSASTFRIAGADRVFVVAGDAGLEEFEDVIRSIDPDAGVADSMTSMNYGVDAMQAYGVEQAVAEELSSADYSDRVRSVLEDVGAAYPVEIAAAADVSIETCRRTLVRLRDDGEVEQEGVRWQIVK